MEENKKRIDKKQLALVCALFLLLAIFVALAILFGGDGKGSIQPRYKDFFGHFNAVSTRVSDYSGGSEEDFVAVCGLAEEMLDRYHKLFDIYNTYEGVVNIKALNDKAGEGPVKISSELFDFLEFSKEVYTLTRGEVNIAMGAVLSIWHDCREAGNEHPDEAALPDMALLTAAAEHTDINDLVLDKENMTAALLDPEMSLDVGAIAKGYSVEKIAEAIKNTGRSSYVIDSGGNIRAIGEKPDGSSWKTGIKNPFGGEHIYTTELRDSAAVTSGNYERYYTVNGARYHHIIDKDTLMPSSYFASVTIIAPDSGLADALSTALFNMSYDEGRALADSLNIKVVWVTPDGAVKTN